MANDKEIQFFFEEIATPQDLKGMLAEVRDYVVCTAQGKPADALTNLDRLWLFRDFFDLFAETNAL